MSKAATLARRAASSAPPAVQPPKRKRNFEKAGTVKIPWYRGTDGRTFIDPRKYGRKVIAMRDHEAARREALRIAIEINGGGVEILALTPQDRAIYAETTAQAARHGRNLLGAVSEWTAAQELIEAEKRDPAPRLLDIVRAGLAALCRPIHLTGDVVGELLISKAGHEFDGRYERDLKHQLRDFAAAFPGDIAAISDKQVAEWLDARRHQKTGAVLSPKRRGHIRANLVQLFKFARGRGYLPDKVTAAQQVPTLKVRRSSIGIFTAEEILILLKHVPEEWLPWLAIGAFSGVRCEEIALSRHASDRKDVLRWSDFDWTEREICVRSEVSKTGHPRRCPIHDNLYAWLTPWRESKAKGPVVKHGPDVIRDRFKARLRKLATQTDEITPSLLRWPHNALRHSYGSYRMAEIKDMQRLSYEMGNTISMIQRHYHNPRPASEAAAWFSVFPTLSEKVIQLTLPGVR